MDLQHLTFCQPGTRFYDRLRDDASAGEPYPLASGPLPDGWERETNAEWAHLSPADREIRPQGWKVHASATLDNADEILRIGQDWCLEHRINFKFVRSKAILMQRNSKYGDRSSSGKFITIYPAGDDELRMILEELGALLEGQQGPYILSDLRWRGGPLYVRFGGFVARMSADETGQRVPCVEDPEGNLVPDVRGPAFRPPPWAQMPSFLQEAVEARARGTMRDFPFRVTSALHFSNGGGVYRGTDTRTGQDVLLKEARPHAGVDEVGRDAVERLETERRILVRLDGIAAVPSLIDYRKGSEHLFLVREFVEGKALQRVVSGRNPLLNGRDEPEALQEYTDWAMRVLDDVAAAVDELHARGIVYADLHPGNILITPDDEIAFVDFETSDDIETHEGQTIGAPGFRAPPHYRGIDVDRYAMGCLRLSMFVPLTTMLPWDPTKADDLIALVAHEFPVPEDFGERVRDELGELAYEGHPVASNGRVWAPPTPADWAVMRERIVRGILGSATPERDDRLYPGDVGQFLVPHGGLSLAYGAAGVIAVLADGGLPVPPEHLDWLTDHARAAGDASPGLHDGLAGIAYALELADRGDDAQDLLARARSSAGSPTDDTLLSGSAGIGLALAFFARRTGSAEQLDAAVAIADGLTGRGPDLGDHAGVLRGPSGPALLYLALYDQTGDGALLDHAAAALRADLARMGWRPGATPDSAEWNLGLLQTGSGGAGIVLAQLLARRPDDELLEARDAIHAVVGQRYAPQPGLLLGRAGLLLARHELRSAPDQDPAVAAHLRALGWHALPVDGTVMFFGDGLLRLSCDLASGSAGVLAVVDHVLGAAEERLALHLFGTR